MVKLDKLVRNVFLDINFFGGIPVIQTPCVCVYLQTYFLADPCMLLTFSFPVECFIC